jgi:hypothetical protein
VVDGRGRLIAAWCLAVGLSLELLVASPRPGSRLVESLSFGVSRGVSGPVGSAVARATDDSAEARSPLAETPAFGPLHAGLISASSRPVSSRRSLREQSPEIAQIFSRGLISPAPGRAFFAVPADCSRDVGRGKTPPITSRDDPRLSVPGNVPPIGIGNGNAQARQTLCRCRAVVSSPEFRERSGTLLPASLLTATSRHGNVPGPRRPDGASRGPSRGRSARP